MPVVQSLLTVLSTAARRCDGATIASARSRRAPFPLLLPLSFCVWPTQQRTEETGGRCDSILDGTVALLAFAGGELCLSQAVEKRPALVAPQRRIEPSSSKSSSKALT